MTPQVADPEKEPLRSALESLRESEEFKTRLIEGSRDCLKVLDLEGRLLSMNAGGMSALEICDLGPVVGASWFDFWEGADKEAARKAVETARSGGVGRFVGFFPTRQTHQPRWWDVVVNAILGADRKPEKLLAVSRDVTALKQAEELLRRSHETLERKIAERNIDLARTSAALREIVEGVESKVGEQFFPALVQQLAKALNVTYSFVSEFCIDRTKVRTLAFWAGNHFENNFEYALAGTPCEKVLAGEMYHCTDHVADQFPRDKEELEKLGVLSYLAIPITSSSGQVLGHLAVMDCKRMELEQLDLSIFKVFGARAGAELERTHMEALLKENEERLRDLFDEAPIAYVHEGLDSRFIRANRAAMRSLGITPDEVQGTYGKTFIPDTPEAQRRLKEALASIGRGTDTSGVVLELRRKDNGKPLWIQWWSKPDLSGTYTRTMFVDITERVMMEQEKARLEAANVYLQEEIKTEHNFDEIIGSSPALLNLLRQVEQISKIDSTVLVLGETGTGKELIARAIHDRSPRKNCALVKVNCG